MEHVRSFQIEKYCWISEQNRFSFGLYKSRVRLRNRRFHTSDRLKEQRLIVFLPIVLILSINLNTFREIGGQISSLRVGLFLFTVKLNRDLMSL